MDEMRVRFKRGMNERWEAAEPGFALWARADFWTPTRFEIVDFWRLGEGDSVELSSPILLSDLPSGLWLTPEEVCNCLVAPMRTLLEAGTAPTEPMAGPEVWRVMTGDRLVWVSTAAAVPGGGRVRRIIDCHSCLVAARSFARIPDGYCFGIESGWDEAVASEDCSLLQEGLEAIRAVGPARRLATEWRLG